MSRKILYLSYDGLTDPLGQSQILPYIYGLAERGYNFTIISFEKGGKSEEIAELRSVLVLLKIKWLPLAYTKHPPILSTLFDIWLLRRNVLRLHRQSTFHIVHCRSYITSLVGLVLKRKYGIPFIFDMRGFWADERVDGGLWRLSNPIYSVVYNYFKRQEKKLLAEADHIVTLTYRSTPILQGWVPDRSPLPISVIPTCVDANTFDPAKVEAQQIEMLKIKLGIRPHDFILTYLGSLGTWYLVREMIDFYAQLRKKLPQARLMFVTRDDPEMVIAHAERLNLPEDALIITSAERSEIPMHILLSNWTIFFIQPFFSKSASAPTKMAEIISMGKPIVFNLGVGDMDKINKEYDLGIGFNIAIPTELDEAINYMIEHPEKQVDTQIVKDHYALSKAIVQLDEIYSGLVDAMD